MDTWRGIIGPPNLTAEQIAFWEDALEKAVRTDAWKQELARNTWESNFLKSAATRRLFDSDYAEYRAILTELGLKK
jgi:tripartite-type tricarboxylate transporter receptor subunit TctC